MLQLLRARPAAGMALAALVLSACGATGTPTPSAPASVGGSRPASASVVPSEAPGSTPPASAEVVVTFRVADTEEYRILLTDPADIQIARRLLAGEPASTIPNGVVVRGDDGGVNTGWSWHIDPATLEFADLTIEVCDGLPSDVEAGQISGERYCPWSAEVVDIEE